MSTRPAWVIPFLLITVICAGQDPKSITQAELLEHLIEASSHNGKYPPLARQARIQGPVELTIFVNELGDVTEARIDKGHPMLKGAAENSVKQWKFRPFVEDDNAIPVSAPVTINYRLEGTDSSEEIEFKRDFENYLQLARESLEKGRLSASLGVEKAGQALKLARDANHVYKTAQAQLLLARLDVLLGLRATEDFEAALNLFRQAISKDPSSRTDEEWINANYCSGKYFFSSKDFKRAQPLLEEALQNWLSVPSASEDTRAQIARTAAMLATIHLELKQTQAAESTCKIFKREKHALHGLELDEASQACNWMR